MPVVRGCMNADNRPEWSGVTSAGIFWVSVKDGRFDNHYHDCHEYWLIFKGKAKVKSEGNTYLVKPGDIVCTKAGDDHDVLEVYEDMCGFWFEDATSPGGRVGHLHRTEADAKGHAVPLRECPKELAQC